MKLQANGVRTTIMHALMHTQGLIARPWDIGMELGACPTANGLGVIIKAKKDWKGKIVFDIQRHKHYMGKQLHDGLELKLKAAERITLHIEPI